QAANESSAISSVRAINSAQISYRFSDGGGVNYADSLATLNLSQKIDSKVASGFKSGYIYILTGVAATTSVPSYFDMIANPSYRGYYGSAQRSFASNESYIIFQRAGADLAPGPPPPADRTPANSVPLD